MTCSGGQSTANVSRMFCAVRRGSGTHLSQLADLVAQSTDPCETRTVRVLHRHVIHQRVDLARQNPDAGSRVVSPVLVSRACIATYRMMVRVVMSSETRTPILSLSRWTALLHPTT